MTLTTAATIFAILFLLFLYVAAGRKVWQGESGLQPGVEPEWWPLSAEAWQGVARSWLASVPFLLLGFCGYLVHLLTGADGAAAVVSAIGFFGVLALMASITLFNRPRSLVPPHRRSEPGSLAARRARRR